MKSKTLLRAGSFMIVLSMILQVMVGFWPPSKVYAEDESLSLAPYISKDGVSITYTDPNGTVVQPEIVDGKLQIPNGTTVNLSIHYDLPKGTLSDEHPSLTLKLPAGLTYSNVPDGMIMDGTDMRGHFKIENGVLTLTFNSTSVSQNAYGPLTNGDQTISGSINLNDRDAQGNIPIKLPGADVPEMTIHVKPDLTITKDATQATGSDTAGYTIQVDAPIGTAGQDVTVSDSVEKDEYGNINLGDLKDIKVVNQDGQEVTPTVTQEDGHSVLVLPPLADGGHYTITYNSKIKLTNAQSISATNSATATLPDGTTSGPATATVGYTPPKLIDKDGIVNKSNIDWTITVNPDKADISGWTLKDSQSQPLTGTTSVGSATIDPPIDGQSSIRLPFTFPNGSDQTYKITYSTPDGAAATTNTAELVPPNEAAPSATASETRGGTVGEDQFKKGFVSAEKDGDLTLLNWNIHITTYRAMQIWLTDSLDQGGGSSSQWFTKAQLLNFKEQLYDQLSKAGYDLGNVLEVNAEPQNVSIEQLPDDAKCTGIQFWLLEVPAGIQLNINYQTTAKIDTHVTQGLGNSFQYGQSTTSASYPYTSVWPTINKLDLNDQSGDATSHDYDGDGPQWQIGLTYDPSAGYPDAVTDVTDQLPSGLSFDPSSLKVEWAGSDGVYTTLTTAQVSKYITYEVGQEGEVNFFISPELYKQCPGLTDIAIDYGTDYDKNLKWDYENGSASKDFNNSVNVSQQGESPYGTAQQKQTITRKVDNYSGISKTVNGASLDGTNHFQDNVIPYSIEVNPKGVQLVDDDKPLTVTDTLNLTPDDVNSPVTASLVNNSVEVYKLSDDGKTETLLSPSQYKYTLETETEPDGKTVTTMVFKVPDGMPLKIEYNYRLSGDVDAGVTADNTASMNGTAQGQSSSGSPISVQVQHASSSVNIGGIQIQKSDADNYATTLPDAEFEVYGWDDKTKSWEAVEDKGKPMVFTTNDEGMTYIDKDVLSYFTAYYIQEVKAPAGYILDNSKIYFIMTDGGITDKTTIYAPDGRDFINSKEYHPYLFNTQGSISISNRRAVKSISIQKLWQDEDGKDATPTVGLINVNIYQNVHGKKTLYKTVTLDSKDDWKVTVNNLPVYENPSDQEKIHYTVEEATTSVRWTASYAEGMEDNHTITNTVKPVKVSLPMTGTAAVLTLPAAGAAMIGAGLYTRRKERKNRK